MSVDVAGGRAFVSGTEATYQGVYFAENRGSSNIAVAASDPTNPRIDLVVMRVRDSAYSGATDTVAIEVVTGTPAASPVAPTLPDSSLLLAEEAAEVEPEDEEAAEQEFRLRESGLLLGDLKSNKYETRLK